MGIHKTGYQSREFEIENLIQYERIDRIIPIASSQNEQVSNPDTIDSDGDSIPDIYDAFPAGPFTGFSANVT